MRKILNINIKANRYIGKPGCCDQFINCADCEENLPGCCWFRNTLEYIDGKFPKIEYEYRQEIIDDQK